MAASSTILVFLGTLFMWPLLRTQVTGVLLVAATATIPWAQDCYYLFLATGALFVLVMLPAKDLLTKALDSRWFVAALSTITSAANLFVAFALCLDFLGLTILVASVLLCAICFPMLIVAWAFVVAPLFRRQLRVSSVCLAASFAGSFAVGFLQYLPQPWPFLLPICCPLIAGWCWYIVSADTVKGAAQNVGLLTTLRSLPVKSLIILVTVMFLSCILIGVARSGSIAISETIALHYSKDISTIIVTTIMAIMLNALFVAKKSLKIIWIYIFTILCIGQLIILAFDSKPYPLIGIGLSSSARASLSFLLYFFLLSFCYEKNLSVVPVFLAVFVSTNIISDTLSFVAVPAFSNELGLGYTGIMRPVSLVLGIIVFICFAILSGSSLLKYPNEQSSQNEKEGIASNLYKRVEEIVRYYKVSTREREILLCLLQGFSYKATASELNISEATVQSHIKRLYAKLDVHSRQELIEAVRSIKV